MRALRSLSLATSVVILAACGSDTPPSMPDVVGQRLDEALSDLERAGIDDEPEVLGGGVFGVVDESNWQVCDQSPADGAAVSSPPRLTVERECPSEESDEAPEPTTAPETPSSTPSAVPSETSSEEVPDEPAVLTIKNNEDLAELLTSSEDYAAAARFAAEYAGQDIEFDGNIAAFSNHADYDTRYDILIGYGDFSRTKTSGPAFQFRDVNAYDMNFVGKVPNRFGLGDNLRFIATVGKFEKSTGLFLLVPVSTELR